MEDADNSLFLPVALDGGLKDRIAILRILECDSLYGTLDLLHEGLLLTIIHVRLPGLTDVLLTECICEALGSAALPCKECRLTVILEGRPVAADGSVVGDDGLEDAAVVMGVMPVLGREYNVTGLIADEVFVVGRNQEELAFSEASRSAIVGQIELPTLPLFNVDGIAQERNPLATVADVQARPPDKIL